MSGLHLTEIHVRRAPGCANGWSLRGLSPGINVVIGPNASGKTTTARAIAAVLWPAKASPRGEVASSFSLDDSIWHAEVHGTHAAYQRDGVPGERPQLPSAETMHDRCLVPLHDLLKTTDDELGKAILREAAGDFDLDMAAKASNFADHPRLARSAREAFAAAQREVERIRQELVALAADSTRLLTLTEGIENARAAASRASLISQAIEKCGHAAAHARAAQALSLFDSRLAELTGNELSRLENDQIELEGLHKKQEELAREETSSPIADCQLPEGGVPAGQLEELRARIESLRSEDTRLEHLKNLHAVARERIAAASKALGATSDPGTPDLPTLNTIAKFVCSWESARSEKDAVRRWRDWLGTPADPLDLPALREAASALSQWLRSPDARAPRGLRAALAAIAAIILLGSSALALSGVPLAWLGLLPAAALLIVTFARVSGGGSPAAMFPATDIAPPREWTPAAVQERLQEIHRQIGGEEIAAERRREFEKTGPEWERITAQDEEIEAQRRTLCGLIGCDIDPRLFSTFVGQAEELRQAQSQANQIAAQLEIHESARSAGLDAIAEILARFSIPPAKDLTSAITSADSLDARDRSWHAAEQAARARQREREELQRQCEQARKKISLILENAKADDADDLARLIAQLDGFRAAREAEKAQHGLRDEAAEFFRAHPEFQNRPEGHLECDLGDARKLGEALEPLVAEKAGIEMKILSAKHGTRLEEAVGKREAARRSLIDDREAKLDALAGHLVAEHVRTQMGELAMPPVFERARELFSRFTSHAWQLVPPDGTGQFRARDTVAGGAARPLAELSSGTRVQLLLAMRTAFVAEQERGTQLPLLLDETLANSDDLRARHIIEAIAELARNGRQIFYFTAQAEEVAKWREFFSSQPDVPHHFADLALARNEPATADFERIPALPPIAAALPGGLSYEEYGLLVSPFEPRARARGAHLWHLCEDTSTLHRLLAMGFERWGQIEDVLRHQDKTFLGPNAARLCANARLADELCDCWQHGRGRPIMRESLGAAGVSTNFIDRVWEVACKHGRDARKLLEAMDRGEIPRLQKSTIEKLRLYFEEKGHTSREVPLDAEEIRGRLQALAATLEIEPSRAEALMAKIST